MAIEDLQWTAEEIAIFKARNPDVKPFRVNMIYKKSTPRIVNVRATEKGAMCPEFKRWLFDRVACPTARDWIRERFEVVK